MSKEELYKRLKDDGAKLRAINFYKLETLKQMCEERFGVEEADPDVIVEEDETEFIAGYAMPSAEPEPEQEAEQEIISDDEPPVEIRTLFFTGGGWCNETQSSYAPGYYRPKTVSEYLALRKFAAQEF